MVPFHWSRLTRDHFWFLHYLLTFQWHTVFVAAHSRHNKRLHTHASTINLEITCCLQFPVCQLKYAVASKTESLFNIQDRSLLAMSLEETLFFWWTTFMAWVNAQLTMNFRELLNVNKGRGDDSKRYHNLQDSVEIIIKWWKDNHNSPQLNHYSTYKIGVCWQCHWKKHPCSYSLNNGHGTSFNWHLWWWLMIKPSYNIHDRSLLAMSLKNTIPFSL